MPRRLNAKELLLREQLSELKRLIKTERDTERAERRETKAALADLLKQRTQLVRCLRNAMLHVENAATVIARVTCPSWSRGLQGPPYRQPYEDPAVRAQDLALWAEVHARELACAERHHVTIQLFDLFHGIAVEPDTTYIDKDTSP